MIYLNVSPLIWQPSDLAASFFLCLNSEDASMALAQKVNEWREAVKEEQPDNRWKAE